MKPAGNVGVWQLPLDIFSNVKKNSGTDFRQRLPKRVRSYYKAQNQLITAYEDLNFTGETHIDIAQPHTLYRKAALLSKVVFTMLSTNKHHTNLLINFLSALIFFIANHLLGFYFHL